MNFPRNPMLRGTGGPRGIFLKVTEKKNDRFIGLFNHAAPNFHSPSLRLSNRLVIFCLGWSQGFTPFTPAKAPPLHWTVGRLVQAFGARDRV